MMKLAESVDSSPDTLCITKIQRNAQEHEKALTETLNATEIFSLIMLHKAHKAIIAQWLRWELQQMETYSSITKLKKPHRANPWLSRYD